LGRRLVKSFHRLLRPRIPVSAASVMERILSLNISLVMRGERLLAGKIMTRSHTPRGVTKILGFTRHLLKEVNPIPRLVFYIELNNRWNCVLRKSNYNINIIYLYPQSRNHCQVQRPWSVRFIYIDRCLSVSSSTRKDLSRNAVLLRYGLKCNYII
jgi:hypothetical protein